MRPHLRAEVAAAARRLHAAGWVANHDGNVSVRCGRDRFLCTPTAVSKAAVDESMLVVVDAKGALVEGTRKPFGEMALHLAIYRARPDAEAVLHAHPPTATAFGVAGVSLEVAAMPEFLVSLGPGVPTVPLALPGTPELAAGVDAAARNAHAFLCAGNGVFSLGPDLDMAFLRMELVEHYAKIVAAARQLGGVKELSQAQVAKMLESRARAGLTPPSAAPAAAPAEPAAAPKAAALPPDARPPRPAGAGLPDDLEDIAARVAARLAGRPGAEGELRKAIEEEIRASLGGSRA